VVSVKIVLMGELKRWAGTEEVEVELAEGSTVRTLTQRLLTLCGDAFARRVLTKEGVLQPHIAVFINGVQMGRLEGNQTVLTGGRVEMMLLPTYEGG
jgi:molybdopterin converting factor small subunit